MNHGDNRQKKYLFCPVFQQTPNSLLDVITNQLASPPCLVRTDHPGSYIEIYGREGGD